MTLPSDSTAHAGLAGAPYPVSLGGRPYLVDLSRDAGFVERSIPLLKAQSDDSGTIAENSLNPEDLVRRGMETWHHGMGQTFQDRAESNPYRFSTSNGIDCWSKWQLSLLWDTKSIRTLTTAMEGSVASVGSRLYVIDGNNAYFTASDLDGSVSWTTVTGTPAAAAAYMATDGFNVYLAFGASGIYHTTASTTAATSLFTGNVNYLWYVKGRLLASNGGGVLYNPTDFTTPPNALPTALLDKGNDWLWDCAAEGTSHIYIGGYRQDGSGAGDHSEIYKTAVKPDGTALDVPTVAATLPDGERITGMCGYLGFVIIGVDNVDAVAASNYGSGVRLAQIQSDGNLVLGPKIDGGTGAVYGFEAQDRFVWFTWTNSGTQAGLGRLDLSEFTGDLQPAYTQDLMYNGSSLSHVRAITTHQGRRVFRVSDDFLACEDFANRVASGTIDFGKVTYGVPDNKVAMFIDLTMDTDSAAEGSVEVFVSVDGGTFTSYGSLTASGTVDLSALEGETFQLRLVLSRGSTVTNTPIVTRATLRSFINANRTREFIAPLIIRPRVTTNGMDSYLDTDAEIAAVAAMVGSVQVFKMGTRTEYVHVKDYEVRYDHYDEETGKFGGLCMVKMQVVA
jgi:hypothetical protein